MSNWDGRLMADARRIPLKDESVQMVCTSPPYYGLRDFEIPDLVWGGSGAHPHEWGPQERGRRKDVLPSEVSQAGRLGTHDRQTGQNSGGRFCDECGAWKGQLGLEPTVKLYVEHLVEVMREVRRVLRDDGVVFLNVADSYSHGTRRVRAPSSNAGGDGYGKHGYWTNPQIVHRTHDDSGTIKAKDLCLIPEAIALALRDDGWYIRQRIIWAKMTPMPESIRDRPTSSVEYIWLLSKSRRYFWDKIGAAEVAVSLDGAHRGMHNGDDWQPNLLRNMRNFWVLGPDNYLDGEHFAVFPREVPRRAIRAATSEKGACADCGAPYRRVLEKVTREARHGESSEDYQRMKDRLNKVRADRKVDQVSHSPRVGLSEAKWRSQPANASGRRMIDNVKAARERGEHHEHPFPMPVTVGWAKTCACTTDEVRACIVLDAFAGTNTTGLVAEELNRRWIAMDLGYQDLQAKRLSGLQKTLALV